MAGAEQVGGHREVAGQQGTCGAAAAPDNPFQIGQGIAKEQVAQPLAAPLRLTRQAGDQGAMDGAAQAPGRLGPEQGGDIGEAQQPAGGQLQRLLQQPGRPPAAPNAGQQGSRLAPAERPIRAGFSRRAAQQIATPFEIRSGQIAPAPQGCRMGIHLQAPALQHGDALLQAL